VPRAASAWPPKQLAPQPSLRLPSVQRLKNRAQFDAAMAGGTVSRTPHFVLHRVPLDAPSASAGPGSGRPASGGSTSIPAQGRGSAGSPALFAVQDEAWIGAVVPKRWARRAVTRNGIRRQIYTVSDSFASHLPLAAHVVRLRMDFARADYPSAWSEALKAVVRGELLQLFEKARR
jgi:ribonuclease P protein component